MAHAVGRCFMHPRGFGFKLKVGTPLALRGCFGGVRVSTWGWVWVPWPGPGSSKREPVVFSGPWPPEGSADRMSALRRWRFSPGARAVEHTWADRQAPRGDLDPHSSARSEWTPTLNGGWKRVLEPVSSGSSTCTYAVAKRATAAWRGRPRIWSSTPTTSGAWVLGCWLVRSWCGSKMSQQRLTCRPRYHAADQKTKKRKGQKAKAGLISILGLRVRPGRGSSGGHSTRGWEGWGQVKKAPPRRGQR